MPQMPLELESTSVEVLSAKMSSVDSRGLSLLGDDPRDTLAQLRAMSGGGKIDRPAITEAAQDIDEFMISTGESSEAETLQEVQFVREALALSAPDRLGTPEQYAQACEKFEKAMLLTSDTKVEKLRDAARLLLEEAGAIPEELSVPLSDKAAAPAVVRYHYAQLLNAYGHANNNESAKMKSVEVLKDLSLMDFGTFITSAEMKGLVKQAMRGDAMNHSTAAAEWFCATALEKLDFPRYILNPRQYERLDAVEKIANAYRSNFVATDKILTSEMQMLNATDRSYLQKVVADAKKVATEAKTKPYRMGAIASSDSVEELCESAFKELDLSRWFDPAPGVRWSAVNKIACAYVSNPAETDKILVGEIMRLSGSDRKYMHEVMATAKTLSAMDREAAERERQLKLK